MLLGSSAARTSEQFRMDLTKSAEFAHHSHTVDALEKHVEF